MSSLGRPRLSALVCSVMFLACELICRPWAEMGVADDWSYVRSAQLLAQTGHVHYVGWASAIVGWQFYLGAASIKLFGFSFTAARLPTLLIALLTACLMQRTLVRFGISEGNAVLGTLTFVLSPLFMQLSATMMTDVPGFFSVLACLYGCLRALQSLRDRDAVLWIGLAVAVNTVCGTSRQLAWLGVLVLVPSTLWLLRGRRRVLTYGLAATALGYLGVFALWHSFSAQPFTLLEPVPVAPFSLDVAKMLGHWYVRAILEIALLLIPLFVPYIAALRSLPARAFAGMAGLVLGSAALLYGLGGTPELRSLFYPFLINWVGPHAGFEGTMLASNPPIIFGMLELHLLSAIVLFGMLSFGTVLLARPRAIEPPAPYPLSWPQILVLLAPLTLLYLALLSHRALEGIYDRYLLVPIFIALICILLYSQQHLKVRWHLATGTALAATAFYGILCTHNTFALDRARVVLAQEIHATGVPFNHVDLGWEMNGWYELQLADHVNAPFIANAASAYHFYPTPPQSGCHSTFLPYGYFPHFAPQYGIAFQPGLCEGPAPFAPVSYATWPLLHPTTLYVVRYPLPAESPIEIESHRPAAADK